MKTSKTMSELFPRSWGRWPRTMMLLVLCATVIVGVLLVALLSLVIGGYAVPALLACLLLFGCVQAIRGDLSDRRYCAACGTEIAAGAARVVRNDGCVAHFVCPPRGPA